MHRNAIEAEFGLRPVVAAEIEFYLPDVPDDAFWLAMQARTGFSKWEKEKGANQWEVAFPMSRDAAQLAAQITLFKKLLKGASFAAKPYPGQPGSGLHIHVHLEDAAGKNVFYKRDREISDALRYSIGGLLATMLEHMPVFAPKPESRARFIPGSTAPTTVSWGTNNRTVAVRLPDEGAPWRHIEHRVAGADADPAAVLGAVLSGIYFGLKNQCDPGDQMYGDASLGKYALTPLTIG